MSSWLTSFKSKGRVLCCGSYTSPVLILFDSIFYRIFDFIFLVFEPYDVVDPFTAQCPLSVFGVSLPIKGQFLVSVCQSKAYSKSIAISSKPNPKFPWWNILHRQLILKSTKICSKFVLLEMFKLLCWTILISINTFD